MIKFFRSVFGRRIPPQIPIRAAWHEIIETVMCDRTMRRKACYPREVLEYATNAVANINDRDMAIDIIEAMLKPYELQK